MAEAQLDGVSRILLDINGPRQGVAFSVPLLEGHAVGSDLLLDNDLSSRLFGDILRLHGDGLFHLKLHF